MSVIVVSLTTQASPGENDWCFAMSLDGKKISHVVLYARDFNGQEGNGPAPIFNVRVYDFESNTITGSLLNQKVVEDWQTPSGSHGPTYPASHDIEFSYTKMNGKKVSYDIKLTGVAKDIGGGLAVLHGKSEVSINGKTVSLPSLKTMRWCPDPSNRKEFKEIESRL